MRVPLLIDGRVLQLGLPIANGTFGSVSWAQLSGTHVIAKQAHSGLRNAAAYLDVEEHVNRKLARGAPSTRHVAPFVGSCRKDGVRTLVWLASGERTLDYYLACEDGLSSLARDLDVPFDTLQRVLLRELLGGVALLHSLGLVHRDLKPENVLIDAATRSIRLIDFGSACDMSNWPFRRGFTPNKGPASILYCPPEHYVTEAAPFAYDVYSAALIWLRCMVPAFRASEDSLYDFRLGLRDRAHHFDHWLRHALLEGEAVAGGDETCALFDDDDEGRLAWRLLLSMLAPAPTDRISAAAALSGAYLGGCVSEAPPEECELVEHEHIVKLSPSSAGGLSLDSDTAAHSEHPRISGVAYGSEADLGGVREGDMLLGLGPIDTEGMKGDEVRSLLSRWRQPTVTLRVHTPPARMTHTCT